MKVIFLDIDGVLNFAKTDAKAPGGCRGVASQPVKTLAKIVKATGAKIVLASTWGMEWSINDEECSPMGLYLVKKLRREGLHIMDTINDSPFRGHAILEWLQRRPNVTDWIILDDTFFSDYESISAHLVQTNDDEGLTENMIDECVRKLDAE